MDSKVELLMPNRPRWFRLELRGILAPDNLSLTTRSSRPTNDCCRPPRRSTIFAHDRTRLPTPSPDSIIKPKRHRLLLGSSADNRTDRCCCRSASSFNELLVLYLDNKHFSSQDRQERDVTFARVRDLFTCLQFNNAVRPGLLLLWS